MKPIHTFLLVAGASGLGAYVSYKTTKKAVLRRCRSVVLTQCGKVPLFSEEYCAEQASEICKE